MTLTIVTQTSFPKFGLVNCHSVVNKTQPLHEQLVDNDLALCALTKTWNKEDDDMTQYAICPLSYKAISVPRYNRTGGGIAVMFKDTVSVKCESVYKFES